MATSQGFGRTVQPTLSQQNSSRWRARTPPPCSYRARLRCSPLLPPVPGQATQLRSSSSPGSSHRNRSLRQPIRASQGDKAPEQTALKPLKPATPPPKLASEAVPGEPWGLFSEKENSRIYRRTVFNFPDWRKHRSDQRYLRHITGLLGSRIVRGLSGPLLYTVTISTALATYETALAAGVLPEWCRSLSVGNNNPFNQASFALSLLLVFRTNSSYARWWEARKIWGGIINRSRDLVRQGESWFDHEQDKELLELLRRWTITYSRALQTHLREDGDIIKEVEGILTPVEAVQLARSPHRPNFTLEVLSAAITAADVADMARLRMDENLTFFEDTLGKCERILKSPIPLSWTRHTSRFLVIWLTFMPFTLWNACGWGIVPVSTIIAFLLLGIEEIGVQIEEPFGILPLEAMCATIEKNLRETGQQRQEVVDLIADVTAKPASRGFFDEDNGNGNGQPAALTAARQGWSASRADWVDGV